MDNIVETFRQFEEFISPPAVETNLLDRSRWRKQHTDFETVGRLTSFKLRNQTIKFAKRAISVLPRRPSVVIAWHS